MLRAPAAPFISNTELLTRKEKIPCMVQAPTFKMQKAEYIKNAE